MITTKNFIITPLKSDEELNSMLLKMNKQDAADNPYSISPGWTMYSVSDLGGKGVKYRIGASEETGQISLNGLNQSLAPVEDSLEIQEAILSEIKITSSIIHRPHYRRITSLENPILEDILKRNSQLEELFLSIPWFTGAYIPFLIHTRVPMRIQSPEFNITLVLNEERVHIPETLKALMVEYEIYEKDFKLIQKTLTNIFNFKPELLTNIGFEYTKEKGLF